MHKVSGSHPDLLLWKLHHRSPSRCTCNTLQFILVTPSCSISWWEWDVEALYTSLKHPLARGGGIVLVLVVITLFAAFPQVTYLLGG